jgi:TP901 family phage tail tape measure protein
LGSKLSNLTTTLANTARWQLSSSMLHGFIGAVQTAYGYAKDLNESLNNIRIVTGYNTEQMAEFAQQANKAAKALSTTTTSYTDAALIFYQQGLTGDAVTARTDTVIKMANVTGETASTVSDYMTAVWNNFAEGSENLEYYADVMTALGAATASSTDEIAAGLEKFAAVADTVGLSYEYATAALATVTATTRQSADVVGTAFKTLFARIQDLELGETLDDGTTLGSYSEALAKVGINIKDTSGELKDMDVILEEMASKWDTLGQAEKTALAQSVAGVRQYTQLIALMDNWDFMQDNLKVTSDAKGTLQEQADIYAESWDAASNRVRASLETIYSQILKDDFFISIANGFSSLLDSVSTFIDGIGGIKGIIIGLGSVFLNVFANKIQPALNQLRTNFEIVFMGGDKSARKMAEEMSAVTNTVLQQKGGNLSATDRVALENATQMSGAKNKLLDVEKQLTPLEKQRYETELSILELEQKELAAAVEENTKKQEGVKLAREELQLAEKKLSSLSSYKEIDVQAGLDVAGADRDKHETMLRRKFEHAQTKYQDNGSPANLASLNEAKKALHELQAGTEVAEASFEKFL